MVEQQAESVISHHENGLSAFISDDTVLRMSNAIHQILTQSFDIFSDLTDNKEVKDEVLDAQETEKFVFNLVQVFRVFKRLRLSYEALNQQPKLSIVEHSALAECEKSGFGQSLKTETSESIEDIFEAIESVWRSILRQFVGKPSLIPNNSLWDFSDCTIEDSSDNYCGLCYLSVSKTSKETNANLIETVIGYENASYHSICINFWINCVSEILPNK